jgi:multiple sugar transport system substrate-binding protein
MGFARAFLAKPAPMSMRLFLTICAFLAACIGPAALAGTLVINANTSDPAPRAAWQSVVAEFQRSHPGIEVKFNLYDHESYKKAIRNWLTSAPPDVVFWNVGYRMRQFVTPGLLENVSELFTAELRSDLGDAAVELVSVGGAQFGVPFSQYQIGLYYRKDLLENAGFDAPPQRWADLLEVCARLKQDGIAPIVIGSRDLWPTAGWFDYIDLRTNGYEFHRRLMDGKVPFTDPRVRAVFVRWRELLDKGCFVDKHASLSWQESQALLYRGTGAMMLIGNFIVANFPPEMRDKMEFTPFPVIDDAVGRYEEAPMNSLHIPARARNKEDARKFLAYVLRPEVQEKINAAMLTIPVNRKAAVADDRFLQKGRDLLAGADGLMQYFDRETSEDLATVAMKGFQEFMVDPDRLDQVLESIERARKRIYKAS